VTYGPASVILSHDKSSGKRPADFSSISSKKSRSDDYVCYGCGKKNHSNSQCPSKAHPDYNTASIPWVESVPGIAWQAKGYSVLPQHNTLSGVFFDGGKPFEKSKSFSAPSSSGGNKNFSAHSSASGDKKGEFIPFLRENYKSAVCHVDGFVSSKRAKCSI